MHRASLGKVLFEQATDLLGPINPRALLALADPTPAQQGRKEHKQRSGAVSLVLVILPRRCARRGRQRRLDVRVQLFAGFIHRHQRFVVV